jgi:16S rRNA C967 or C1407 C5-methylase (RsmB/RsmF family)
MISLSGRPLWLAADAGPWCAEGFWIEREDDDALPLGSTAEHLSGLFYIQEASSMLPVAALFADNPQPERVMDVAAARGRKPPRLPPEWATRAAFWPMSSPPAG